MIDMTEQTGADNRNIVAASDTNKAYVCRVCFVHFPVSVVGAEQYDRHMESHVDQPQQESPYQRVLRLIETGPVEMHGSRPEVREAQRNQLAQHIAGNLWPDLDNQPTFQQDAVQELVGALEWASDMALAYAEDELLGGDDEYKAHLAECSAVLAKYQVKP